MKLVSLIPDDEIVLVGDLNDRGKDSRKVIEWAMKTPNVTTVDSNHGHMFVDFYDGIKQYDNGIFLLNGGDTTLRSYGITNFTVDFSPSYHPMVDIDDKDASVRDLVALVQKHVPKDHIEWLRNLPLSYEKGRVFVSHAPWNAKLLPMARIWNRYGPFRIHGKLQIYGHNSSKHIVFHDNSIRPWAVGIDTSHGKILTCYNTRNGQIYQVPYQE